MQFVNPWALSGLLLALPLIALYLLRTQPRRQQVSTVRFWQAVIPETNARRWWRRLRYPLSLFIQLALLLLLVLALADLQGSGGRPGRRRVVVLDNSASMRATDVAADRLSVAKRHVRRLISSMGPQDEMAIVSAGTRAQFHRQLTTHQRTLQRTLADIEATDGPNQLADAVALGRRLCRPDSADEMWVVTDPGGRHQLESSGPPDGLRWIICGQPSENTGITQFQVRRQSLDPVSFECWVEVTRFADTPLDCELRIELDEQLLDVIPLRIAPSGSLTHELRYLSAQGGVLRARLNVADALAVDNDAVAWLSPCQACSVSLVTQGDRYLESVLTALPLVNLTVQSSLPATWPPSEDGVWIMHQLPVDQLPAGRSMVVQPVQDNRWWHVGAPIRQAMIGRQQPRSSLLTHVQLSEMFVSGARQLQLPATANVLASTLDGDPICAIVPHDLGETLVLNVDLQAGDFAWRTAFPVFMSNALRWLCGQTVHFQPSYAAGDVVELDKDAFPSVSSDVVWQVTPPDGSAYPPVTAAGPRQCGPLDRVGIWTLRPSPENTASDSARDPPMLHLACNVVNRDESDLSQGQSEPLWVPSYSADAPPLWRFFLGLVLLSLALEWWLYQRRWID